MILAAVESLLGQELSSNPALLDHLLKTIQVMEENLRHELLSAADLRHGRVDPRVDEMPVDSDDQPRVLIPGQA
jgi:hypothetical protein